MLMLQLGQALKTWVGRY